jgi:hypothetical protein
MSGGNRRGTLCDAVFFPVHDSEQRQSADTNHRPCRRFRDTDNSESNRTVRDWDQVGVHRSSRDCAVDPNCVRMGAAGGVVSDEEFVA